jgi:hypothetical protein
MRKMLAIVVVAGAAACAPAASGPGPGYARAADLPPATPIGPPTDCLSLIDVDHTNVLGDRVIDFVMKDRRVFRNVLPAACPTLGAYERFAYRTSIGRLCSVDVITVQDPTGRSGPTCGLGAFQPIAPPAPR